MQTFAKSGDVAIAFSVVGEGRPLVMLHGFGMSGGDWTNAGYCDPLLAAGHRLIAVDLRGHGQSSKPHDPAAYAAQAEAADIVSILDSLEIERADIIGYARGGRLALELATLHPRRIRKLIVGGAHPYAQDLSLFRLGISHGIDAWIGVIEQIGGQLEQGARERIAENDVEALRAAVANDLRDISAKLTAFNRPCLFYAGASDPVCDAARRAALDMPRGESVVIKGCNHITAWQRSECVLPHIGGWLAKTGKAGD
jgi:pimeloyl-ACP methyl ester carboxylesterase